MNIYDEALQDLNQFEQYNGIDLSPIHRKALERAKKVEELLDLYREKTSTLSINHAQLEKERKIEIEDKIQALEEELK